MKYILFPLKCGIIFCRTSEKLMTCLIPDGACTCEMLSGLLLWSSHSMTVISNFRFVALWAFTTVIFTKSPSVVSKLTCSLFLSSYFPAAQLLAPLISVSIIVSVSASRDCYFGIGFGNKFEL